MTSSISDPDPRNNSVLESITFNETEPLHFSHCFKIGPVFERD